MEREGIYGPREGCPLTTTKFAQMQDIPSHETIGSIMWACLDMHSDIAFAVTIHSCFTKKLDMSYQKAITKVLEYLKGTKDLWATIWKRGEERAGWLFDIGGSMAV